LTFTHLGKGVEFLSKVCIPIGKILLPPAVGYHENNGEQRGSTIGWALNLGSGGAGVLDILKVLLLVEMNI
jgi:hypothetical protein